MRIVLLLAALALSGCAQPAPPGSTGTSGGSAACGAGPGPTFLAAASGGGFVPAESVPRLVEITHEGVIRILQGYTAAGNGSIREDPPGALHDLAPQEARDMLARRNVSLQDRDMVVTRGDTATLPAGLWRSFCDHVTAALPTLRDEYPNAQHCADEGNQVWDVSITSAQRHIVVDDCAGSDADAFRSLQHELDTLVGPG